MSVGCIVFWEHQLHTRWMVKHHAYHREKRREEKRREEKRREEKREAGRQADRQAGRQAGRQAVAHMHVHSHHDTHVWVSSVCRRPVTGVQPSGITSKARAGHTTRVANTAHDVRGSHGVHGGGRVRAGSAPGCMALATVAAAVEGVRRGLGGVVSEGMALRAKESGRKEKLLESMQVKLPVCTQVHTHAHARTRTHAHAHAHTLVG